MLGKFASVSKMLKFVGSVVGGKVASAGVIEVASVVVIFADQQIGLLTEKG